ncbi:MAG TPA: sulfatase-like hydrolase/transferase [Acidobacteriota bacterium]|nr:sulfatase-like hydrolase/transferase [Acidobacteriota bacterium]
MVYRFFFCFLLFLPGILTAEKSNLLLITIDTLRADHLGSYGNRNVSTPNLDAIASKSLLFENAICQAPLTLPSHTSLMTGRYPIHHGVHDNAGTLSKQELTLAEILKKNGYNTYAFVGGFPLDHRFGLNQGFDQYDDSFPRQKNRSLDFRSERNAEAVVSSVLKSKIVEPFFLWVHFYDPHAPYLNGGYEGEIEFVDQQIGVLLQKFRAFNPIIAVAGDHGESLGEHGEMTHRIFIYDSTMRVPFFIQIPGTAQQKIKAQTRLIDFIPTVLKFLKVPAPAKLDGVILPENAGSSALIESMFPQFQLGWSPLIGVRTDEWKYILAPKPELYHLPSDPKETKNIAKEKAQVVSSLRKLIPLVDLNKPQQEISPELAEQLASLGYVSGNQRKGSNIDPKDRIQIWNQIELAVDLEKTKPDETIPILEQAQQMDPNNPMVLGFLAQKYAETGNMEQAKSILKKVLTSDPKNSLALYRMASVCLQTGAAQEAKSWAEKLKVLESSNADAFILLARSEMALGNLEKAIANIQSALQIDPNDLDLRTDLGNLYLQGNKPALAREEFEKILRVDTKNIQALNGLATCDFYASDLAASEIKLQQALKIDASDPQTRMNLALVYSKQGKIPEAIQLYKQIASSPNTPEEWKQQAAARLRELE